MTIRSLILTWDDIDPLELIEWDGRFYGSAVREYANTPLGGFVLFCCGCEWRIGDHRIVCGKHVGARLEPR